MARLEPLRDPQDPELKRIFDQMIASFGAVPNALSTMAHHQEIFVGLWGFISAMGKAGLDRRLLELAYLKTSLMNECHY
jgi:alkylhydroperoxidase family enzyme